MYGILFDLDGTLVDSDSIHFEAWQKIFTENHVNAPLINREFFSDISEEEQDNTINKKELLFRELTREKLQATKGLDEILEYIKQNRSKLKIGLATNAARLIVDFELSVLNSDEKTFFDAVIHFDEFRIDKSNPNTYVELARRLNVDKNSCIVFVDSESGVRAAVAADINCIGILTSVQKDTLEHYGTWRTAKNFQEINLDEIWNTIRDERLTRFSVSSCPVRSIMANLCPVGHDIQQENTITSLTSY